MARQIGSYGWRHAALAIAELRPRGARRQGIVPAPDDSMVMPCVR